MNNHYAIELSGISKRYKLSRNKSQRMKEILLRREAPGKRNFYALSGVNLKIRKGEIIGIVGRNGSGKSTLLKIISGISVPTEGKVRVQGSIVPLLELGSGLNPEFTGIENIYFLGALMGFRKKQIEERMKEIVDFAEIEEFIDQPLRTYSSGMKARLAFAVSVNIEPDILILDEILSVGDEVFKRKSFEKMMEFFHSGKTILFVSHSPASITELCTRAVFMDKGRILMDASPEEVINTYKEFTQADNEGRKLIRQELLRNQNHITS